MRRVLFIGAGAAAGLLVTAGFAGAEPGQGAVQVRATTGVDQLAVAGAEVGIEPCGAPPAPAALVTGTDGTVRADLMPGCYQVRVTASPSGCSVRGVEYVQMIVLPGVTQTAPFQFSCA
ncbi:hypothetical protein F5X71_06080 [Nocardia brasiliensis]|uniref:Carboxypeptidase regulatory-like domain-containing protein n=1 Tax=Nocardia brasiliensis TaxID=37326 RepID=A0A6G9XM48_NOCBR|nr:hypothetical protein [Nocardia brasiliensis]QIS01943.1 hypothetical protein F5X71_06080 [Nocardia brasiliensis]